MTWSAGAVLTAAQLNTYVPQAWSTWTPTVTASSGTFTTVSSAGRYIQMGETVHWAAIITITTVGTAANFVLFTLPVTSVSSGDYIGSGKENAITGAMLQVDTSGSTTQARVIRYDNATAIGAGHNLILSGTYQAA